MPKFVLISEDEGVPLHGFNSREDFIDNLRYLMAEMYGDAVKFRELKRLRGEDGWEKIGAEPNQLRLKQHQKIIDWVLTAQPGDMYVEEMGRRVFCLNDSVGEVRWL